MVLPSSRMSVCACACGRVLESVMSTLRHWLCLLVSSSLLSGTAGYAATPQPPPAQAMMDALTKATTAVVGVKITALEDARSAETLGLKRAGSGVQISPDGLILTIGYLML